MANKVKYAYLIKRITTTWDGCNGAETSTEYLNWVFGNKVRADKKAAWFNENRINSGPGYRHKYEVEKQEVL